MIHKVYELYKSSYIDLIVKGVEGSLDINLLI